jgi:hypothetical protein
MPLHSTSGTPEEIGGDMPFPMVDGYDAISVPSSAVSVMPRRFSLVDFFHHNLSTSRTGRRRAYRNRALLIISILLMFGMIAAAFVLPSHMEVESTTAC